MIFSIDARTIRLSHFYNIRPTTQCRKYILEVTRTSTPNNTRKTTPTTSRYLAAMNVR